MSSSACDASDLFSSVTCQNFVNFDRHAWFWFSAHVRLTRHFNRSSIKTRKFLLYSFNNLSPFIDVFLTSHAFNPNSFYVVRGKTEIQRIKRLKPKNVRFCEDEYLYGRHFSSKNNLNFYPYNFYLKFGVGPGGCF